MQLAKLRLHVGLVLFIGHAKPHGIRGEHGHRELSPVHHVIHKHRQQAFGLDRIRRKPLEEIGEVFLQLAENPWRKSPEIHAHRRQRIQQLARLSRADIPDFSVFTQLDLERFHDLGKVAVLGAADAAGHGAILGNGVLELIAHHGRFSLRGQGLQLVVSGRKRGHAIVIVRIDDGEGLVNHIPRDEHRMHRAERLGALLRDLVKGRNA